MNSGEGVIQKKNTALRFYRHGLQTLFHGSFFKLAKWTHPINWILRAIRGCIRFFQAEDGIRDRLVTGVQTCALPILAVYADVRDSSSGTDQVGRELEG